MDRKRKLVAGIAGVALATGLAGGGIAVGAAVEDDEDVTVTGPDADRATAAALEATGGGQSRSVERDEEGNRVWEVEITKADGTQVEVNLDGAYGVVGTETDDGPEDDDDDADDADDADDDADDGPDDD
jgi:hypothetical protein